MPGNRFAHAWKGSQGAWTWHDAWVHKKQHASMGYLTNPAVWANR